MIVKERNIRMRCMLWRGLSSRLVLATLLLRYTYTGLQLHEKLCTQCRAGLLLVTVAANGLCTVLVDIGLPVHVSSSAAH